MASRKSAPKSSGGSATMKTLLNAQAKAQLARARAEKADAEVQMVRAKITASGRQVVWDPKTGAEKIVTRK